MQIREDRNMQINDIFEADERIKKKKRTTPLLNSPFLDEIADRKIFIKANVYSIPEASNLEAHTRNIFNPS